MGEYYFQALTGNEMKRIHRREEKKDKPKASKPFGAKLKKYDELFKSTGSKKSASNAERIRKTTLRDDAVSIMKEVIYAFDQNMPAHDTNEAGKDFCLAQYGMLSAAKSRELYRNIKSGKTVLLIDATCTKMLIERFFSHLYDEIGKFKILFHLETRQMKRSALTIEGLTNMQLNEFRQFFKTSATAIRIDSEWEVPGYNKLMYADGKIIKTPKGPLSLTEDMAAKAGVSGELYKIFCTAFSTGKPNLHPFNRYTIDNMAT